MMIASDGNFKKGEKKKNILWLRWPCHFVTSKLVHSLKRGFVKLLPVGDFLGISCLYLFLFISLNNNNKKCFSLKKNSFLLFLTLNFESDTRFIFYFSIMFLWNRERGLKDESNVHSSTWKIWWNKILFSLFWGIERKKTGFEWREPKETTKLKGQFLFHIL